MKPISWKRYSGCSCSLGSIIHNSQSSTNEKEMVYIYMEYVLMVESKWNNSEKDKYYVILYEYSEKDKVILIESENRMVVTSAGGCGIWEDADLRI